MTKTTAIIGATPNPSRYAYLAAEQLSQMGYPIVPIGIKKGELFGKKILNIHEKPEVGDIHTVTMYVGPQNQIEWESYLLSLKPKRIIFNPGAENPSFAKRAGEAGIQTLNACTLVMLRSRTY